MNIAGIFSKFSVTLAALAGVVLIAAEPVLATDDKMMLGLHVLPAPAELTAVPEPATYMLFGTGLLLCAQMFRRKKR